MIYIKKLIDDLFKVRGVWLIGLSLIASATLNAQDIAPTNAECFYPTRGAQCGSQCSGGCDKFQCPSVPSDDPKQAQALGKISDGGTTSVTFDNACATATNTGLHPAKSGCTSGPGWCDASVENDLWFRFTPPASGNVAIEAGPFDTQLALYAGPLDGDATNTALSNWTLVYSNDNQGGKQTAMIYDLSMHLDDQSEYYIQVDGADGSFGIGSLVISDAGKKSLKKSMMKSTLNERDIELSAYPNPFSSEVTIAFRMPEARQVRVEVFHISGKKVADLFDATVEAGTRTSLQFDGTKLPAGVYFYRLTAEELILHKQMILAR